VGDYIAAFCIDIPGYRNENRQCAQGLDRIGMVLDGNAVIEYRRSRAGIQSGRCFDIFYRDPGDF